MRNKIIGLSLSNIGNGMRWIKESGLRREESLKIHMIRRMQCHIRSSVQMIDDIGLRLRIMTNLMVGISAGNTSSNYNKTKYLFRTSSSSMYLPLSLEICIAKNIHPFWQLCFACIDATILTIVHVFFPYNILLSPSSSRHSIALSYK